MILFLIGLATGVLSGMGVGGGILLVPVLIFFFQTDQAVAQGVILAIFIPTAIIAMFTHYHQGNISVKLALILALGALFGALAGAWLANTLNGALLQKSFGFFLLVMGSYELFSKHPKKTPKSPAPK